jgi:hypothetical protein
MGSRAKAFKCHTVFSSLLTFVAVYLQYFNPWTLFPCAGLIVIETLLETIHGVALSHHSLLIVSCSFLFKPGIVLKALSVSKILIDKSSPEGVQVPPAEIIHLFP